MTDIPADMQPNPAFNPAPGQLIDALLDSGHLAIGVPSDKYDWPLINHDRTVVGWRPHVPVVPVLEAIAAERRRQIEAHGWTPEHDDHHDRGEIADAAADFASTGQHPISTSWAYGAKVVDKEPRRQQLIKAAALLVAEIERLDRAQDPACTDCDGLGITKQTERRCACQPAPNFAACCNSTDVKVCDCVRPNHIRVDYA